MGFSYQHRAAEDTGPVVHDSQAEAFAFAPAGREAHTVIPHAQNNSIRGHLQANCEPSGFSMFDRIPHGLLCDPIKMNLGRAIMNDR